MWMLDLGVWLGFFSCEGSHSFHFVREFVDSSISIRCLHFLTFGCWPLDFTLEFSCEGSRGFHFVRESLTLSIHCLFLALGWRSLLGFRFALEFSCEGGRGFHFVSVLVLSLISLIATCTFDIWQLALGFCFEIWL